MSNGAKDDKEKLRLSLVPRGIVEAVAAIREYGTKKYGNPDNWRTVDVQRFHDAALRHMEAAREDFMAKDPESGYPHLWHVACNLAFIFSLVPDMGPSADSRRILRTKSGQGIAFGKIPEIPKSCRSCDNLLLEQKISGDLESRCKIRGCINYSKWKPKNKQ